MLFSEESRGDPKKEAKGIKSNMIQKKKKTIYYVKVSGIPSGNRLIKTIRYPHM